MSASIDIVGLYSEFLFEASLGGMPFWMLDSNDEGGRRVLRFLFPGQDKATFQDLGQIDGAIGISGLLIGDDFTAQADQLRAVFRMPGPLTLQHPFMGELQVMQAEQQPKITHTMEELRVARFTASFFPYSAPAPPQPDTLQDVLDALDDIRSAAADLLDLVLAPAALTVGVLAAVEDFASAVIDTWNGLVAGAMAAVATAAGAPLAVLGAIADLAPDGSFAANVAAAFGDVSAAIAETSTPPIPAAVAPGAPTAPATPVDGRVAANLILGAAAAMTAPGTAPAPTQALAVAARCLALADAVSAATDITFDSQQEASAWQQTLMAALGAAATEAALLAVAQPTGAGTLWRALVAAQSAVAADMNATIGRLPSVVLFTPPGPASIWQIAQYLAGDNSARVLPLYLDIVARNDIRNPGAPPPGPLEVLL